MPHAQGVGEEYCCQDLWQNFFENFSQEFANQDWQALRRIRRMVWINRQGCYCEPDKGYDKHLPLNYTIIGYSNHSSTLLCLEHLHSVKPPTPNETETLFYGYMPKLSLFIICTLYVPYLFWGLSTFFLSSHSLDRPEFQKMFKEKTAPLYFLYMQIIFPLTFYNCGLIHVSVTKALLLCLSLGSESSTSNC